AIAALHRVRPDWRLAIVTQREHEPLLVGLPAVARVVGLDRRGGPRAFLALRAELRRERYDVAVDLQGNWKSAFVTWLSGARDRLGAAKSWRREPTSRVLLRRTVAIDGPDHPARIAHALVRELAADAPFAAPHLIATSAEIATERAALAAAGVDADRPFRIVVVTDPRDPRALRPAMLAAESAGAEGPVVHLFGPAEPGGVERELAVAGVAVLRHGRGEVRRLVALGAIVAAAGGVVIGPDQGASHVLAAAGADCRVLFGAQDPRRTAPVGATALVHPSPPSCSPCRARRCSHERGPVCMDFRVADGREVPFSPP
ncbi:MAG: glycosyltransferase family 9 protein, partial [Planctomycetes bacterium]|nr:glycosyltransferase family 9 protein [Planctomycetota bacterium]